MSDTRCRLYTFIAYPDESHTDVNKALTELGLSALLSPLHSPEQTEDGKELKRHYHVMVQFSGKKTLDQMNDLISTLRNEPYGVACTLAQKVADKASLIKYFVHDGYEGKEKFSYSQLEKIGAFKLEVTDEIVTDTIVEIISWCNAATCYKYSQVFDYAMAFKKEWLGILLSKRSYAIIQYLKDAHGCYMEARKINGNSESEEC